MKTPYSTIGEAQPESAFLTTSEGFDVARLERITPDEWPDLEPKNYLSPDEWKHAVDIIHYAPAMAEFIVALYEKLNQGISPLPSDDFWNPVRQIAPDIER